MPQVGHGETTLVRDGEIVKPVRLPNGLYAFKEGSGEDRVVLDCITSLQNGADLLWIETEPNVAQIAGMVNRVRQVILMPSWSTIIRPALTGRWPSANRFMPNGNLQAKTCRPIPTRPAHRAGYGCEIRRQRTGCRSRQAGAVIPGRCRARSRYFHHLITLPTYHETALGVDILSEGYFGDLGMLAYVRDIQRQEIRRDQASVKHQDLAGSNIGDDHKEYFSGDNALLASGEDNTMNQF